MAVGHLTYLDLRPEHRRQAANRAREQIYVALGNPFLTAEQRVVLDYQVERINHWENGTLDVGAPIQVPAPPAKP